MYLEDALIGNYGFKYLFCWIVIRRKTFNYKWNTIILTQGEREVLLSVQTLIDLQFDKISKWCIARFVQFKKREKHP